MKTRLQEYALLADIIGGLAIVISLIFVGLQINQGNKETRAATIQAVLDSEMFFQSELIRNAGIWEKVAVGGDFSDTMELRKAIALFNMLLTQDENQYLQQQSGFFTDFSTLDMEQVGQVASPEFIRLWRASPGASARSAEYLRRVDAVLGLD